MSSSVSFAELTNGSLDTPRRIIASNLPLPANAASDNSAESGVEVLTEELNKPQLFMDGKIIKTMVFTTRFPASTDGHGSIEVESAPGGGIALPQGISTYYLDFAPGVEFPLHRTTSLDFIAAVKGELSLLTPGDQPYTVEGGKAVQHTNVYTVAKPGDILVQRGIMHGLANRSNEWARAYAVVIHSNANKVPVGEKGEIRNLDDIFLS